MKKFSLFLFTLCVSVMTWADGLNPYAYNLSSTWDSQAQKLTVRFNLNAMPNMSTAKGATGIQILAYEVDNPSAEYYIHGVSTADINSYQLNTHTHVIDFSSGKSSSTGVAIPSHRVLSWKVRVNGENESKENSRKNPEVVFNKTANRPYKPHGVAIDTCYESANFGKVYITEANTDKWGSDRSWYWMNSYTRPCVWVYKPNLTILSSITKKTQDNLSTTNFSNPEPHRVRVSADGRTFVSSFHSNTSTAVWEHTGDNNFNRIITHSTTNDGRVIAMDVTGRGSGLKILLCYIKGNTLTFKEFSIGTSTGVYSGSSTAKGSFSKNTLSQDNNNALVSISYDDNGDSFWFAFDETPEPTTTTSGQKKSYIYQMTKSGSEYTATKRLDCPDISGSGGILVKGNLLVKGTCTSGGTGKLNFYTIGSNGTLTQKYNQITVETYWWVNDIAMDYVGNLYLTSGWTANAIAIGMPYGGQKETPAPSRYKFTLSPPVPNILANDLRCTPHATQNKYIFSFNVNTKPEVAQLRFYDSYEDMKKSLNEKNADKYQGTNNNKPAFVYNIPEDKLKQGRIEVVLGGVAGQVTDGVITNDRLPAGVLYWSVYVKTRTSHSFAPVYTQPLTGKHAHNRLHATVNNYPETDNFGYIYAPDYATNNVCKLMVYSIGDGNVDDEDRTQITSTTRYDLVQNLDISQVVNTRRPAVAPDGSVFLADFGASTDKITTQGPAGFDQGGVWVFNPNLLQNKSTSGSASVTRFHSANETSSGVCFYGTGNSLKLYKTNTYDEIARFPNAYNESARLTNGYRIFNVGNSDGTIKYTMNLTDGTEVAIKTRSTGYGTTLKDVGGDANGNISIKVVSDGVWLCQHRSGTAHENPTATNPNPDSFEATALMFQNNNGKRAFSSFEATVNGASLSQTGTSIMQSTPGAGMAISPDEKYLYVVNHEGNILEFQIGGTANAKTLTHTRTFVNTTQYKTISTLNFDYVGNLVASTDKSYPDMETQIVVFTMPREQRTNACEIQAPNSCRMIPERVAQLDMNEEYLAEVIAEHKDDHPDGCAVDLYRPLQGKMFNTICLPFDLNLDELPNDHPLKNAVAKKFTGLSIDDIAGEKILSLVFTDLNNNEDKNTLIANVPYIIQPRDEGIRSIVRFDGPIKLTGVHVDDQEREITYSGTDYKVTFHGIVPYQDVAPNIVDGVYLTLMLVADNRLAAMTSSGQMLGFRGYFDLNKALPQGIKARITTDKKTPTNTTIVVDGQKVNVEKFLREGRVYIRMGESLYTVDGQLVK